MSLQLPEAENILIKPTSMRLIGRGDIARMYDVVKPHIRVTPVLHASGADFGLSDFPLTLKLECLQHAGSFKTRGAFAHLLTRDIPAAGVVAASGGNHGAAVAYAASKRGVPATIFVPHVSSPAKIARIEACGANLRIVGERYSDALRASEDWATRSGAMSIHAFDQIETLLGQGTLAHELSAQVSEIDTVLVSIGGGGLIAGLAAWYGGSVRVIGVEPEQAPTWSGLVRRAALGRLSTKANRTHGRDSQRRQYNRAPRSVDRVFFNRRKD